MKGGAEMLILITALKGTVITIVYCLPIIVATFRRHYRRRAITTVNLLLGWTIIGWLMALAWASLGRSRPGPPASRRNLRSLPAG